MNNQMRLLIIKYMYICNVEMYGFIHVITLKPKALKVWGLSRHLCCQLLTSLTEMEVGEGDRSQMTHKEEGKSRIETDAKDSEGLR